MNKLNDNQELEERTAFYYLYYGQDVATFGNNQTFKVGHGGWNLRNSNCHLLLTDLKDISDEHAIEVAKMCFSGEESQTSQAGRMLAMNLLLDKPSWFIPVCAIAVCDFLRRNGYLLPYAGYSTQQLIDLGWVKLRTNN